MPLGVLAPTRRSRDIDAEAGGQKPADIESRRCKSRRSKRSGLESKSGSHKLRGQDRSWKINR